jgi:hypothetical protein
MRVFTVSILVLLAIISAVPQEAKIVLGALALMTSLYVISEQMMQGSKS